MTRHQAQQSKASHFLARSFTRLNNADTAEAIDTEPMLDDAASKNADIALSSTIELRWLSA